MSKIRYSSALIIGAGSGLSASLARLLASHGLKVGLAARNVEKLTRPAAETRAPTFACDATAPGQVKRLFQDADKALGEPDVVIYNASGRLRGSITELDPAAVQQAMAASAFGGFLAAQEAAKRMLKHHHGAILFTG